MGKIKLTEEQRNELIRHHREIYEKRLADRIKAILMLDSGYTAEEVSQILLFDERTIRKYKNDFLTGGVDLLMEWDYQGRPTKLTKEQEQELTEYLRENLYSTAKEITVYIKKKYNVEYTSDGLVIALHRLGFSYKKTKAVPSKVPSIEEQKKFDEQYRKIKESLTPQQKIFFMDAVHPTHNVMPMHGWIKTGEEKKVKSNTGRQRININGLYSPSDHEVIMREDKTIDTQSSINLLQTMVEKHPEMDTFYVFSDNARYYYAKNVREYIDRTPQIKLIHLPAYSPNLNLIERLWKLLKKHVIYNKYYEKFKDFKNAIYEFFYSGLKNMKEILDRVLCDKFHFVNSG